MGNLFHSFIIVHKSITPLTFIIVLKYITPFTLTIGLKSITPLKYCAILIFHEFMVTLHQNLIIFHLNFLKLLLYQ